MSKLFFRLLILGGIALAFVFPLAGQSTQPAANAEENLTPEDFTNIIKEAWTFLKDETKAFLDESEKKTEFETTSEFRKRIADLRQAYLAKTAKFSDDKKYGQREFGILFKAQLVSYDADKNVYRITSPTAVEIPYDIPWLDVSIDSNPLVALADSIARGYRSTSMYLKMKPPLRYEAPLDLAKGARTGEAELYFRVRLTMNMVQNESFKDKAKLTLTAYHIELFNRDSKTIYWQENL